MTEIGFWNWVRSVPAATQLLLRGDVKRSSQRVGQTLHMRDGRAYVPFRNTVRLGSLSEPVVLQPRFHLRVMPRSARWRYLVFRRVCIVTTPFFVGLDGFRSKLWMEDEETGDFAGLYQWDGMADAHAYAEGLSKILRPISVPGSVSYELMPGTVDEYLG